jgi:hypothetical protein
MEKVPLDWLSPTQAHAHGYAEGMWTGFTMASVVYIGVLLLLSLASHLRGRRQ